MYEVCGMKDGLVDGVFTIVADSAEQAIDLLWEHLQEEGELDYIFTHEFIAEMA